MCASKDFKARLVFGFHSEIYRFYLREEDGHSFVLLVCPTAMCSWDTVWAKLCFLRFSCDYGEWHHITFMLKTNKIKYSFASLRLYVNTFLCCNWSNSLTLRAEWDSHAWQVCCTAYEARARLQTTSPLERLKLPLALNSPLNSKPKSCHLWGEWDQPGQLAPWMSSALT